MTQPKIANYESSHYLYLNYWKGREYENQAERLVLKKFLTGKDGNWFIDVGGAYGRLLDEYYYKFQHPIIMDYSTLDLSLAPKIFKKQRKTKEIALVAGNVYNLPFKNNSLDGGLCVRVMHHLEKPELFFKEIKRVLKTDGFFILEFAHKHHLKAIINNLFRLNFQFFSDKKYLVPRKTDCQGIKRGQKSLFFNFSFRRIKDLLEQEGLKIQKKQAVSWFRLRILKRLFPTKLLIILERIFQLLFSWTNLTPSLFLLIKKEGSSNDTFSSNSKLEDILANPVNPKIDFNQIKNNNSYNFGILKRKNGVIIYDLRYPRYKS